MCWMTSLVTALFVPRVLLLCISHCNFECKTTQYRFNKAFCLTCCSPCNSHSVCRLVCSLFVPWFCSSRSGYTRRGGGGARWFWSDGLGATTTSPPWEQRGEVRANERQLSFLWSQHATANVMRETSGADQWQINTRNMRVTLSHRNSRVFSTGLCSLVLGTSIFDTALHRWYIWKCRGLCVDRCTMSFLKTSRLMKGPLDFHLLSTAEVFFCKPRSSVSHAFF